MKKLFKLLFISILTISNINAQSLDEIIDNYFENTEGKINGKSLRDLNYQQKSTKWEWKFL